MPKSTIGGLNLSCPCGHIVSFTSRIPAECISYSIVFLLMDWLFSVFSIAL